MAEELLAAAAIAAVVLNEDEDNRRVETEWSDGSILGSYSVDGGTVDIISQTAQPGSGDEGLLRLAANAPAGRRYPDETRPGVLMNTPSGIKYRPDEIQKVADEWIDAIPEEGPNNPPGPQPGPTPGRPELPGGPVNPGGGLSDPGSFAPLVMNSSQPDLVTGITPPSMMNNERGSLENIGIETVNLEEPIGPPVQPGDFDGDGILDEDDEEPDIPNFTPNLSSNMRTQIEALQAGEESCFKLAQGQGWTYLAGGKVLQLEEGGLLDTKTTPGVLALQINDGYTLRMVCGVEGGFLGIQGSATSDIFDDEVIKRGDPGVGLAADAVIENEYADFIMQPGDSIQVDIDGISGVGDFRVTSRGIEITDSYAVRNDVQFAIVPNTVQYRQELPTLTEDDIERRDPPPPINGDDNGNGNGNGSSDRMSPLSVILVLAGLGAFIYFLVTRRRGGGE